MRIIDDYLKFKKEYIKKVQDSEGIPIIDEWIPISLFLEDRRERKKARK